MQMSKMCQECKACPGDFILDKKRLCEACWNDATIAMGSRDHDTSDEKWVRSHEELCRERDKKIRARGR